MEESNIESQLYRIFTFYSIRGNPLVPDRLKETQAVRFMKDILILQMGARDIQNLDDARRKHFEQLITKQKGYQKRMISRAQAHVLFTTTISRDAERHQNEQHYKCSYEKFSFKNFVNFIMKIAVTMYNSDTDPGITSVEESIEALLENNILPEHLARRRSYVPEERNHRSDGLNEILACFESGLNRIFLFYGSEQDKKMRKRDALRRKLTRLESMTKNDDVHLVKVQSHRRYNTMTSSMGYAEFLKFAADFGLSGSRILSSIELAETYFSSCETTASRRLGDLEKLTFDQFQTALIFAADRAYSKKDAGGKNTNSLKLEDKVMALFLYMWKAINKSVPRAISERRGVSTYAGNLLQGAMEFNRQFIARWKSDHYRDYLATSVEQEEAHFNLDTVLLSTNTSSKHRRERLQLTGKAATTLGKRIKAQKHNDSRERQKNVGEGKIAKGKSLSVATGGTDLTDDEVKIEEYLTSRPHLVEVLQPSPSRESQDSKNSSTSPLDVTHMVSDAYEKAMQILSSEFQMS